MSMTITTHSTLTCPSCGQQTREQMPIDACQYFYDCPKCGALLRPKPGDCCVYCSYGDVRCPSIQLGDGCRA
jgi:hypothetical protein